MIVIGITGTDGAGKGETVRGTVARGCQLFCKNSDNLYSSCKERKCPQVSISIH